MRSGLITVLATGILAGSMAVARGEQPADAKAVVDRAIQAAGGAKELGKIKGLEGSGTGTYSGGFFAMECRVSGAIRLPNQKKMKLVFGVDGFTVTHMEVVNGNEGWINERGSTNDMNADQLAEIQGDVYVDWLTTLLPLRAQGTQLQALGQSQLNGRTVQGILVKREGHPNVKLYFDTDSGLLLKARVKLHQNLVQEYYYSGYQAFQGVQRPTRENVQRNGKDFLDVRYSHVAILTEVDPSAFGKP